MKAPRTIIYFICLYALISAICFMVLSILAILSYATTVMDFTVTNISYMMFIIYFRLPSKHPDINWESFGIAGTTVQVSEEQTDPAFRTFIISIIYLALNSLLFVAIFRTIMGIRQKSRNRHIIFWSYFSPFFFIFIAIIIIDFIAAAFYAIEFFMLWSNVDRFIEIMKITNVDAVIRDDIILNIAKEDRSFPSLILFLISSKVLVLLTINCVIIYVYFAAAWKICRENQEISFRVTLPAPKKNKAVKKNKKKENKTEVPQQAAISIQRVESIPETQPKVATIGKMEKTKKDKPKVVEVARIDESEMTEIQLPRIKYQRQPSREIIPLPSPPSFKNRKNEKTKI